MASPSHTSGRSPPKESGPAHPQFANCPACAAKWTRPPGAGWAPGASRGRSFGLGSVLAVKKTSTPNGRFLLPRPTFQARRRDSLKTQAPLLVASGTARILRNPRAHALPDIGRQPDQPAPGRAAASSFSHVMSRPHLAFQYPSFAYGIPTGRGLVTNLAPSALSRPSFPVSTLVSASAMGFPPLPGRFLPVRFSRNLVGLVRWASQLFPGGTFGRELRGFSWPQPHSSWLVPLPVRLFQIMLTLGGNVNWNKMQNGVLL
ncbi:uncharacterized protein LOC116910476 [Rattus rattus]|uniref:uncharacterized protein LOC116910476 n=1 Tax=Rattus rattus TaxID=10117 RepID=UPI0013F2DE5B|nr:uncharacterized protein LOC116910476 [Rattus rattus]